MQLLLNTTKRVEIFIKCDEFMLELEDFFLKHSLPNLDKHDLKKEGDVLKSMLF